MEIISFVLGFAILAGLVRRLSGGRERGGRLGPGTPARFLCFAGGRLVVAERTHTESAGK